MSLTPKEFLILEYFFRLSKVSGSTPTLAQAAKEFRLTRSGIHYFLDRLKAKGVIERRDGDIVFLKDPDSLKAEFIERTHPYVGAQRAE